MSARRNLAHMRRKGALQQAQATDPPYAKRRASDHRPRWALDLAENEAPDGEATEGADHEAPSPRPSDQEPPSSPRRVCACGCGAKVQRGSKYTSGTCRHRHAAATLAEEV